MRPPSRSRAAVRAPRSFTINLEEPWQLRWWADHLGVSVPTLLATIRRVGNDANAVRVILEGNPQEQPRLSLSIRPRAL